MNNKQNNIPSPLLEAPKKFPIIWAVVISVVATAVVVGGGVYLWQRSLTEDLQGQISGLQSRFDELRAEEPTLEEDKLLSQLYYDSNYGIQFITTKECEKYYEVKSITPIENSLVSYGVRLPLARSGTGFLNAYHIMSQEMYNKIPEEERPARGRPRIILVLNEYLLTTWGPPDIPSPEDLPYECSYNVEKITK